MNAHPETIASERLVLAPLGVEHTGALFEGLRDPDAYRFVPGDAPHNANVLALRYRRTTAGPAAPDERWWNWAVATLERPAHPFGTVETSLSRSGMDALLAYILGRSAWERGFAFEASAPQSLIFAVTHSPSVSTPTSTRATSVRSGSQSGSACIASKRIIGADCFKGSTSDEYHFRLITTDQKDDDGQT